MKRYNVARLSAIFLAASLSTMAVLQNWHPSKLEAFNAQDKATQHKTDRPIIPPPQHS